MCEGKMEKIFDQLTNNRAKGIGVIGDSILDEYIYGQSVFNEIPIFISGKKHFYLGGAGNVAANVKRMTGSVRFITILSESNTCKTFNALLSDKDISKQHMVKDLSRDICHKKRLISNEKLIVRMDADYIAELQEQTARSLLAEVKYAVKDINTLILSNYYKGCISDASFDQINYICQNHDVKLIVDCSRMHDFSDVFLLKPNKHEFENIIGRTLENVDDIKKAGARFRKENRIMNLLITMDEDGLIFFDENGACHQMPSYCDFVSDPCGAGDSMIAAIAMCISSGVEIKTAVELSNYAAAVSCQNKGTYAVSLGDIKAIWEEKKNE